MKSRRKSTTRKKPTVFSKENVITGADVDEIRAIGRELDRYHFIGCELSGADLSHLRFEECRFERCNLASARLARTSIHNVAFDDCKLLGLDFSDCDDMLFEAHFDACQLRYASFVKRRMSGTRFSQCALHEADFSEADLSDAVFDGCDLTRAVFQRTRLVGTDFSAASGVSLDPDVNTLREARFSLTGLPGLLEKHGIVVV